MKNSERSFARRIDLTSLQLFVAVCELGSIGRAAEREYIQGSGLFCTAPASDIRELSSLHISPLPAKCILDPHCPILHKILKSVFSDS